MSELLQDVLFQEGDDRETHFRKLRILQDEVIRLQQVLGQQPNVDPGNSTLNFGAAALYDAALPGLYPVPDSAAGFIDITVNGQRARIAVFLPTP